MRNHLNERVFYSGKAVQGIRLCVYSFYSTREWEEEEIPGKLFLSRKTSLASVGGLDGCALAEEDVAVTVGGSDGKDDGDVDGSIGLDGDAGSDRLQAGGDGARVTLLTHKSAQVIVISVDDAVEVLSNNAQFASSGDGGAEDTSAGGADGLANAERVGREGERVDGQVSGALSAVGEGNLGLGNGGKAEGSDGSDELHVDRVN